MHVHCGCATKTSVGPSLARASALSAGQRCGASASVPGRFSYAQTIHNPDATAHNQSAASIHNQAMGLDF